MRQKHVENLTVPLTEVAVVAVEEEDLRVPRRHGKAAFELELGSPALEEPLGVDLQPAQVASRDEIRELSRAEIARPVVVGADGVLVPEPPEGLELLVFRVVLVDLSGAVCVADQFPIRSIELAEVDKVTGHELAQVLEQLRQEGCRARDCFGLAQEVEDSLQVRLS
jgi:hypothetical protein